MSSSPAIAITPWRRHLPTSLHPKSDLYTLSTFYVEGVERAGGAGMILPWVDSPAMAKERLSRFDALLLTGGGDIDPSNYQEQNTGSVHPDDRADLSDACLFWAALGLDMPVLAVCRGAQIMNVALGGSLVQHMWDSSDDHQAPHRTGDVEADCEEFLARRHRVDLIEGSRVATLFGTTSITANSLHHQAIDRVGEDLEVTGRAPDGVIEAIEHSRHPVIGVEWHPERMLDEGHHVLFDWLVSSVG